MYEGIAYTGLRECRNRELGKRDYLCFITAVLLLILIPVITVADENETATEGESLLFLSTQLTPVHEASLMRRVILADFPGKVDFQPYDERSVFMQLALASKSRRFSPQLVGGLHGDLLHLHREGGLAPVDAETLVNKRQFIPDFLKLGKFASDVQYFIPWMQATYIMAANRKALRYLPKGAKLESLNYDQLLDWARNMEMATGSPRLGFPAGPKGLMHRFFQGYLYPSYTGSTLSRFRTAEAVAMWSEFKTLWSNVHPSSLTYDSMDEPLLSGDVWVTWDHTARLVSAFEQRPDDFVAFPAPVGPEGRGYMLVLAGLALPGDVEKGTRVMELIDYLTRPDTQLTTLKSVGFFPVVNISGAGDLSPGIASIERAVREQVASEQSVVTLLPAGLGAEGKRFNLAYKRAFSQIVLREREAATVLDRQAQILREIVDKTRITCWAPDPASDGPCPVE
jgi:multiple sugar transport system substrate-binding protein